MADTIDAAPRTVDEQFFGLIFSDADLLAAAFDEIVSAQWSEPPREGSGDESAAERPGGELARLAGDRCGRPVSLPRHPDIARRARQRSPPALSSTVF